MIVYVLIVLGVVSVLQRTSERRFPAVVFAASCGAHYYMLSGLEGFWYCFTAAFCDLVTVAVICSFATVTRLADTLISISIFSIFVNIYGWVLWVMYLPVESYNQAIMALYLIAILSLLWKDCADDYYRNSKRHSSLRLFGDKCFAFCCALSKEAKA